ncbi:TIGR02221 family CRISPR-associated protein [uncultured Clostridium sp.]|uniref:TIGR02221 family CRISPR-associated protein n=1 Tax=uncultured Clostridium sp. TaxID=59620 RepID=UPI0025F6AF25|nr:TIGR02221 family CRISPR-associated protein [uncultured Clostridium sp.]
MGRKFISVLGASNYKECIYGNGKEKFTTRFIQEAILDIHFKDATKEDKILIFLTEGARKENWVDKENVIERYGIESTLRKNQISEEEIEKIKVTLGVSPNWKDKVTNKKGLENILKEKYPSEIVQSISIDNGTNEDELWNIFVKILENIEDGDEIIFDITHSFRSIPMQALTVLSYAKALKKITIKGIYYGAFEARDKETGVAPIFDLTVYNDILEWTNAVDSFIKYGKGDAIYELFEDIKKKKESNNDISLRKSNLNNFSKNINDFTSAIYASRGNVILDNAKEKKQSKIGKSIYWAASATKESLDKVKKESNIVVKPLIPLLDKVEEAISDFCIKDNEEIGIATIKWCIEKGLIQQGYTALEETIKTYLCNKYGIPEVGEDMRDKVAKKVLNEMKKVKKDNKKENKNEDIRKYFKETIEYLENEDKKDNGERVYIYKKIKDTIPEEIVSLSNVSGFRNDMSHFGFTKETLSYSKLANNLEEYFKEFIDIREKYKGKTF